MSTTEAKDERAGLEQRLETLQAKHRALHAESSRNAEKIRGIEVQLVRAAEAVEREEDQLANSLLRRIDAVRRDKEALLRDLRDEESLKVERERKLARLKTTSKSLMGVLKAEEDCLRHKLLAQLGAAQQRRQLLEKKVQCESATLQELTAAVENLRCCDSLTSPAARAACASRSFGCRAADSSTASPSPESSSSPAKEQVSDSAMLQHLQREILTVQQLRSEAQERIKLYVKKRQELEQRTAEAITTRQQQRDSVDWMRGELARTHELSANSEVLAEWAADREFFLSVRRHRTSSQASSHSTRTVDTSEMESTPRVLHRSFR
jgi:hypothetical protein